MEFVNSTHREMHAALEAAVSRLDGFEAQRFLAGGPKATGHENDGAREAVAWYDGMLLQLAERQSIELAVAENRLAARTLREELDKGVKAEIESLKARVKTLEAAVRSAREVVARMAAFGEGR